MDAYTEAHLITAAIRLLHHNKGSQPSVDDVGRLLEVSVEHCLSVSRKLAAAGILELIEEPFGVRLMIADHLKIEELDRKEPDKDSLSRDLERFMAKKKQESKKIETIQAELDRKKQSMFSSIEEKLKKELGGGKPD